MTSQFLSNLVAGNALKKVMVLEQTFRKGAEFHDCIINRTETLISVKSNFSERVTFASSIQYP